MELENLAPNGTKQTEEESIKFKGHGGKKKQRIKRSKFRRYTPHVLMWIVIILTLRIVFSSVEGWPTAMQWHVILGVLGYQLLMGHGSLIIHTMVHKDVFFFPNTDKKVLHGWVCGAGTLLAALGLYHIYSHKENHFNSIHGVLGLIAFILSSVSSINGLVFYYWQELHLTKGTVKFLHLLTGLLTYAIATVCLMYGYDKKTFSKWSEGSNTYYIVLMAACAVTLGFFVLSPGKIILIKLRYWDHDKNIQGFNEKREKKDGGEKRE